MEYPITPYFTQQFSKGLLKGICYTSSLGFGTVDSAMRWVRGIQANKRVNYKLIDYSFQNYSR